MDRKNEMSEDHGAGNPPPDAALSREGLADQLRKLEAFVASAESQGDSLPPEAVEMVARLKEIMDALEGLTASLGESTEAPPSPENTIPETDTL